MQSSLTTKQIERRFDQVLNSFRAGAVRTDSDGIYELADLAKQLEDQPVKPVVLARMTVTRAVGCKTIIEVSSDSTFNSFYRFFKQEGNRRSTKQLVRTANRNEGLQPWHQAYRMTPGLEQLAARWTKMPGVTAVTVRIIRKRAYRKLITARPDLLGLTKTSFQLPRPSFSFCPSGSLKSGR